MRNWSRAWILALAMVAMTVAACGEQPAPACSPTDPTCNDGPPDETPDPLTVMSVSPANGTSDVDPGTTVSVTFSRSVAESSVTASSFSVGGAAGSRSVAGSTVTFTPDAPLDEGASYTVSVNGVVDGDGVGLASPFSSSFNTLRRALAAEAGADMDVTLATSVTLDGSRSTGTGATFTWTQTAGPAVGALSGQSPTFTAPDQVAYLAFELTVSDGTTTETDDVRVWVLEDGDHALWVSASGSDGNPGTREAPFRTIQAAIDAADNSGLGADIYVAAGNYDESLTLASRVSLYGGFDPVTWVRDVSTHRPVVSGDTTAVQATAAADLTVEGLEILAADGAGSGGSSVAVLLRESTGILLRDNLIASGAGTAGVGSTTPDRARTGNAGSRGGNARLCVSRTSGGGGGSDYRSGGTGGLGGGTNPTGGSSGSTGSGGDGGDAGTSGSKNGKGGGDGKANGAAGAEGAAGRAFGFVDADGTYVADSANGGAGARGGAGYGGGGGGGAYGLVGFCGGSGGGGGGGGEGGHGAGGGTGGGASFGVLLVGQSVVEIADNEIRTGAGGAGGRGANGGGGGWGGSGAGGGSRGCDSLIPTLCTGAGGTGGDGTTGGRGGHGGGGGGGPSIGVVEGPDATATLTGNVFTLGAAGAGGTSSGNPGPAGESVDHKKIS